MKKEFSAKDRGELLNTLKARFEKNINRHKGLEWPKVQGKLEGKTLKLWSLNEMESTGGEPDVVGHDKKTGEYIFYDCSPESPKGRRSVCYDREALESRKEHKPEDNAIDMAAAIGIELLTEEQYRELQKLGNFDSKTSSWVKTPADIRKLGGALFWPLLPCTRGGQRTLERRRLHANGLISGRFAPCVHKQHCSQL
jgi:hypothetical protein